MLRLHQPGVHVVEPRGIPEGYGNEAKVANDEQARAFLFFLAQRRGRERDEDEAFFSYGQSGPNLKTASEFFGQEYPTEPELDKFAHDFVAGVAALPWKQKLVLQKRWEKEPTWEELFEGRNTGKYEYLLRLQRGICKGVKLWTEPTPVVDIRVRVQATPKSKLAFVNGRMILVPASSAAAPTIERAKSTRSSAPKSTKPTKKVAFLNGKLTVVLMEAE